ncbi:hypothetical protein N008_11095 [Hymenobacter sp. APR13]|nr:hypothetical protein N008_11095 [Hymenobacter sp. APR13]
MMRRRKYTPLFSRTLFLQAGWKRLLSMLTPSSAVMRAW